MALTAGAATDRGPRALNQDAHFIDLELGLVVVADGMGGHKAGEVASRMAVTAVVDFMRATRNAGEITWPCPFDSSRSYGVNRMQAALRLANRLVHDAGARKPEQAGMATTIVAVLVDESTVVVGHVGDSRAYVVRGGRLVQMTEDHTLVNALGVTSAQAADPAIRHVLTRGIGMGGDVSPAIAEERLVAGERWLICTDGVHGYLDAGALRCALAAPSPQAAADEAVLRALRAGTTDNATAVVLNVG